MKLRIGTHTVETSNDDKMLFPDAGLTKADVIGYYKDVAELMLPHLRDRFLTLQRYPDGVDEDGFFQQRRPDHYPEYIAERIAPTAGGDDTVNHMVVNHAAGLVYLANQGTIAFHGWLSRAPTPQRPDRLVFDLDPSDRDFSTVVHCARVLRELLELAGLEPYVMTTGSRGLHVLAPLNASLDFDTVRATAREIATAVATKYPQRVTVAQRKRARRGRLYIDTGRNAYGQTAVLPYSLRALPGAPVATPLAWDELGRSGLSPDKYGLHNLRRRMARRSDPLEGFSAHGRKLTISSDTLEAWQAR